jgi:hypothetical protein
MFFDMVGYFVNLIAVNVSLVCWCKLQLTVSISRDASCSIHHVYNCVMVLSAMHIAQSQRRVDTSNEE